MTVRVLKYATLGAGRTITCHLYVLTVLLASVAASTAVAGATFHGLGDLPGGNYESNAYAISGDGSTVVGSAGSADGVLEPFRWTAAGGMQPLGQMPGARVTSAYGVNADGSVIVGWTDGTTPPFRWTSASGIEALPGMSNGFAWGVSGDGSTIAGEMYVGGTNRAVRWTATGGAELLADPPGGSLSSRAFAISRDGLTIIGGASSDPVGAARWTADEEVTVLPAPSYTAQVTALAISDDGSTIVGSLHTIYHREAFRWRADIGMELLDVPESGLMGYARAVSGDGAVIVGSGYAGATIWDATHGPRVFKDLLESDYGLDLSGWTLTEARGISTDGTTIVGIGTNPDGFKEGWIAQIPEPSAICIVMSIAVLLLRPRTCSSSCRAGHEASRGR